ncbi:MAG TPA: hypothetical protein VM933_06890 [Acidimicrobiales bacterium]|nr:hypothetical protein [Acidimicrobiales bacterium]
MIGRRLVAWLGIWGGIVASLVALKVAGVEVIDLFKDAIELQEGERILPWKGALGTLGALCWIGAAACIATAASLTAAGDDRRPYLWGTALVLLVLGLDDALVIHDHLLPYLTGSAVAEEIFLGGLVLLVLAWATRYRQFILASEPVKLVLSGAGLGGAFAVDALQSLGLDGTGIGLIEEVLELLGLVTLVAWTLSEAQRALRQGRDRLTAIG